MVRYKFERHICLGGSLTFLNFNAHTQFIAPTCVTIGKFRYCVHRFSWTDICMQANGKIIPSLLTSLLYVFKYSFCLVFLISLVSST